MFAMQCYMTESSPSLQTCPICRPKDGQSSRHVLIDSASNVSAQRTAEECVNLLHPLQGETTDVEALLLRISKIEQQLSEDRATNVEWQRRISISASPTSRGDDHLSLPQMGPSSSYPTMDASAKESADIHFGSAEPSTLNNLNKQAEAAGATETACGLPPDRRSSSPRRLESSSHNYVTESSRESIFCHGVVLSTGAELAVSSSNANARVSAPNVVQLAFSCSPNPSTPTSVLTYEYPSNNTCVNAPLYDNQDRRNIAAEHVEEGCRRVSVSGRGSSPLALVRPTSTTTQTEISAHVDGRDVGGPNHTALRERFACYEDMWRVLYDGIASRMGDVYHDATTAVVYRLQCESARRVAWTAETITRIASGAADTLSALENMYLSHFDTASRFYDTSCRQAGMVLASLSRSPPSPGVEAPSGKSRKRNSVQSVASQVAEGHELKSSANGGLNTQECLDSPTSSNESVPEPRPHVVVPQRIQQLRMTKTKPASPSSHRVLNRKLPVKKLLLPPWNASTSPLPSEQRAVTGSRAASAGRSSYAESYARASKDRTTRSVEEPTSSFLESTSLRYQVKYIEKRAGFPEHHCRHCNDHWCDELNLR